MVASPEQVAEACRYVAARFEETGQTFCHELLNNVDVVDTSEIYGHPVVTFKVRTTPHLTNSFGFVHGGALSTIVAIYSSLALAADEKYWGDSKKAPSERALKAFYDALGMSRSLSVQMLQPVSIDTDIFVKCTVDSNTKSFSYVTAKINSSSGGLLVVAIHDKMKRHPAAKL